MLQDACEVVLTAKKEHDPSRGKLTTCIGKVARRFLMRKRRENKKRNLQFHAGTIREYERTNQTGVQAVFPQESVDYVQENGVSLWK